MPLIVSFPGTEQTTPAEVGGKGYSLIRMTEAGLSVPPGVVLTTEFFTPWFDEIQASETWRTLTGSTRDQWASLCNELKRLSATLRFTATQQQALEDLRHNLAVLGDDVLFAVRSSSPEEDLSSASFAGGYETRLGVRRADIGDAVRHCFASSLAERVLLYKDEHGFDVLSPRIAVVVQQQIDSEIAGVGFSLNPLTNDYDEAVIDSNWGLGESVVAGLVSPDHFIVDKVSREVVEKELGAKQISIWRGSDGGTIERKSHRSLEFTLSETRLGELTDLICKIEDLYEKPVDIEWAYAGGQLHVLQARPVTTYVPLPPEMLTEPGQGRRLYADAALSKGLTINEPISAMGLASMQDLYLSLIDSFVGQPLERDVTPEEALWFFAGGRMYLNLSNMMWLAIPKKMSKGTVAADALMADILSNIDVGRYRAPRRPPWARWRTILWFIPKILWGLRAFLWNVLWTLLFPERAHGVYQQKIAAHELELTGNLDYSLPLEQFRRTYAVRMERELFDVTMSALIAALVALGSVDRVVGAKSAEEKALTEKLKLGFTGNVVVEMGIALFRLARLLDPSDFEDLTRLVERVKNRRMSAEFLSAWDAFILKYGCRGPKEMDLASPRYGDDPGLALRQMSFMTGDEGFDPEAAHKSCIRERRRAYEILMNRSGWLRRPLLRRVHRIIDLFAGTRDTPKQLLLLFNYAVRKRTLIEGCRLVQEGRLDAAEDIFDLTFRDLELAVLDATLDLRQIRRQRTRFLKMLETHVKEFPQVIDSRGRILRPAPHQERPGELRGTTVSPGVATGPVKLLHDAHEKPVNKGDVLVAYTTDPGWTPLFVNAAAVVLEVGGILQHGAVVAREYGKPCVVGVDRVMQKLRDGQKVEVDGTEGVIRRLS